MKENNFSNQKSALEEYFESLLRDDDETVVIAEPKKALNEAIVKDELEQVVDTIEEIKEVQEVQEVQEINVEAVKPTPIEAPQKDSRTSVADMLAKVEKIVDSKPEVLKEYAEPAAEIIIPMPKVAEQVETEVEIVEEVTVEIAEPEVVEVVEEQTAVAEVTETIITNAGVPEWAEERFQCLLFMVGGLSLAVPLVRLNGVISWSDNIVETPNQTDWYLGVLMNHGNKVEVIDTAVMVLPTEHRKEMADDPAERLSHILLVDDQKWGLACDSIGEVVWLKKDDVKWRSNKTKRPWLLGTAVEHMCAVMDTEAFADMLGNNK